MKWIVFLCLLAVYSVQAMPSQEEEEQAVESNNEEEEGVDGVKSRNKRSYRVDDGPHPEPSGLDLDVNVNVNVPGSNNDVDVNVNVNADSNNGQNGPSNREDSELEATGEKNSIEGSISNSTDWSEGLEAECSASSQNGWDTNSDTDQKENCMDLLKNHGVKTSGIYKIYPKGFPQGVEVVCDQTTDGGGWTVFLQRKRNDPQVDFNKTFIDYATGFGDPKTEYWIGNRVLHSMTRERYFTLWVHATNLDGKEGDAYWGLFMLGTLYDWYPLRVEDYLKKSSLGDAMYKPLNLNDSANNQMFSTYDRDNDGGWPTGPCSNTFGRGGWWFKRCYGTNPTAPLAPIGYNGVEGNLANWQYWDSKATDRTPRWISEIQFKIRPSQC